MKNVNWSAAIIDAIEHRIRLEERMPNRDWDKVKKQTGRPSGYSKKCTRKPTPLSPFGYVPYVYRM